MLNGVVSQQTAAACSALLVIGEVELEKALSQREPLCLAEPELSTLSVSAPWAPCLVGVALRLRSALHARPGLSSSSAHLCKVRRPQKNGGRCASNQASPSSRGDALGEDPLVSLGGSEASVFMQDPQ